MYLGGQMTDQFIPIIFRIKSPLDENGWKMVKHVSLNFKKVNSFVLPNAVDMIFIGSRIKKVEGDGYFIKVVNPGNDDIEYAENLLKKYGGCRELIEPELRKNMRFEVIERD